MSGEKCMECNREFGDSVREDSRFKIDFPRYEKMDIHICSECGNKRRYEKKVAEFKEAMSVLGRMANSTMFDFEGKDSDAVVEAFAGEHRHIQNEIIIFMRNVIIKLGKKAGDPAYEDGRNQWGLNWCKKASEVSV